MHIPQIIGRALEMGAALVVSISGGRDSQAMLKLLVQEYRRRCWQGELFAVHAHLGRAEWKESLPMCYKICDQYEIPLIVVKRDKGDLVDRWQERMETLKGENKPHWSSASARYCTSDLKRTPINKHLRKLPFLVCAVGLRADESVSRAKQPYVTMRTRITGKQYKDFTPNEALEHWSPDRGRLAFTWHPILDYSSSQVWETIGTSNQELEKRKIMYHAGQKHEALEGWPAHPAYIYGITRVSCACCILARKSDLLVGIKHNQELAQIIIQMEQESGFSFQPNQAMMDLNIDQQKDI